MLAAADTEINAVFAFFYAGGRSSFFERTSVHERFVRKSVTRVIRFTS